MGLSFTVGGTKGTFDDQLAHEVAAVLDHAFGEEGDWEGSPPQQFATLTASDWASLQSLAIAELGMDSLPNLLALGNRDRGVYLPTHVRAVSLPLSAGSLSCASLTGLHRELTELADRWNLTTDDDSLLDLLRSFNNPDDSSEAESTEVLTFAHLALAANEAVRRDCPLWLVD